MRNLRSNTNTGLRPGRRRHERKGLFQTQCSVEPAIVIVEIDQNHPGEAPVEYLEIVKPLKKKRRKYLPGERLLIKMNKEQEKKNSIIEVKLPDAARGSQGQVDIDKLTISINRILKDFN
jgi:hypothetical protein